MSVVARFPSGTNDPVKQLLGERGVAAVPGWFEAAIPQAGQDRYIAHPVRIRPS